MGVTTTARRYSIRSQAGSLIKLEGDFNQYFSLSITKGYEVEALEIFTPDVMQELIEKAKKFSMEVIGGHIFIYDNAIVGTKQGLSTTFTASRNISSKN